MEVKEEDQNPPNSTQDSMSIHNLLVLPHLPAKQTRRKEPLVDHNMSHVVISEKYLNIMQSKAMAKAVIDGIKKFK